MKSLVFTAKVNGNDIPNYECLVDSILTYVLNEASDIYALENWIYEILADLCKEAGHSIVYLNPMDIYAGMSKEMLASIIEDYNNDPCVIFKKYGNTVEVFMGLAKEYGKEGIPCEEF